MSHDHSPAEVLRASLVAGGVGATPSATSLATWPVYVSHIADQPDNAICVYDTAGNMDGRLMAGATVRHPGFQVRVRAETYPVAYAKMKAITEYLDTVLQESVVIGTDTYILVAVKQTSDAFSLGREPEGARRETFVVNGTITVNNA